MQTLLPRLFVGERFLKVVEDAQALPDQARAPLATLHAATSPIPAFGGAPEEEEHNTTIQ